MGTVLASDGFDFGLYQDVIPVRWQTTDAEIMRLLGSPLYTSTAGSTSSSFASGISDTAGALANPTKTASQGPSRATSAVTESNTHASLAPGAIAGIVIGSIGTIALFFAGWAFMRTQRRKMGGGPRGEAGVTRAGSRNWVKPELDGQDAFVELEEPRRVTEVSVNQKYLAWEME